MARPSSASATTTIKPGSLVHHDHLHRKFMEFPYVSATRRQLMVNLMSTVEECLLSQLLPCNLPPDVRNFKNPNGAAEASIHIRSDEKSNPLRLILLYEVGYIAISQHVYLSI